MAVYIKIPLRRSKGQVALYCCPFATFVNLVEKDTKCRVPFFGSKKSFPTRYKWFSRAGDERARADIPYDSSTASKFKMVVI
jgi:hypothetical protein